MSVSPLNWYICPCIIFPKILFDAGTWHVMSQVESQSFHSSMMRLLRRCVPWDPDRHVSDLMLLRQYKVHSPLNMVRLLRLSFSLG